MRHVAFIPSRSGSKRLPHKNLLQIDGVSLVSRAVRCAMEADCEVVLSTDLEHHEDVVRVQCGSGFRVHHRPPQLSNDTAQIEDAISHWMLRCEAPMANKDVIVLLQPTSPFRTVKSVTDCIELVEEGCDSAITVTNDVRRGVFSGRKRSLDDGTDTVIFDRPIAWRPRSQDLKTISVEAGSVYAFTAQHFRKEQCRMGGRMGCVEVSELEAWEIDTMQDLEAARLLLPLVAT